MSNCAVCGEILDEETAVDCKGYLAHEMCGGTMKEHQVTDEYGRRTVFKGEKLASESTDSSDGSKPHWQDVDVWRTEAGSYVIRQTTHYRVRHTSDRCSRAEGYEIIPSTSLDTYPCPSCNKAGAILQDGCAQADRIKVAVYEKPEDMIESLKFGGRYSNLARTILADISEQDDAVDRLWNTVVVP